MKPQLALKTIDATVSTALHILLNSKIKIIHTLLIEHLKYEMFSTWIWDIHFISQRISRIMYEKGNFVIGVQIFIVSNNNLFAKVEILLTFLISFVLYLDQQ